MQQKTSERADERPCSKYNLSSEHFILNNSPGNEVRSFPFPKCSTFDLAHPFIIVKHVSLRAAFFRVHDPFLFRTAKQIFLQHWKLF